MPQLNVALPAGARGLFVLWASTGLRPVATPPWAGLRGLMAKPAIEKRQFSGMPAPSGGLWVAGLLRLDLMGEYRRYRG